MLLRDAQEETRVLLVALRNAGEKDPMAVQVIEAYDMLAALKGTELDGWSDSIENGRRAVGVILMMGMALANKLEIDSAEAFKFVLLEKSP